MIGFAQMGFYGEREVIRTNEVASLAFHLPLVVVLESIYIFYGIGKYVAHVANSTHVFSAFQSLSVRISF